MRQDLDILVSELKLSNWLIISTCYLRISITKWKLETSTSKIKKFLIFFPSFHDIVFLMGNFNMTPNHLKLNELIEDHKLHNLILEPTCFKSINVAYVDNLSSKKTRFMRTLTLEAGVSEYQKFIAAMLRSTFTKGKPKKIFYRCYKNFDNEKFEQKLTHFWPMFPFYTL